MNILNMTGVMRCSPVYFLPKLISPGINSPIFPPTQVIPSFFAKLLGASRRTRPLLHLHTAIELATPGTLHGAGGAGTTHRDGGEGGATTGGGLSTAGAAGAVAGTGRGAAGRYCGAGGSPCCA